MAEIELIRSNLKLNLIEAFKAIQTLLNNDASGEQIFFAYISVVGYSGLLW